MKWDVQVLEPRSFGEHACALSFSVRHGVSQVNSQNISNRKQVHVLFSAITVGLAIAASSAAALAGQASTAGLQDGGSYDRFIVKYRDGSAAGTTAATLQRSLGSAISGAGLGASSKGRSAVAAS